MKPEMPEIEMTYEEYWKLMDYEPIRSSQSPEDRLVEKMDSFQRTLDEIKALPEVSS